MHSPLLVTAALALLTPLPAHASLYSKSSPVLQVTGKTYDSLIAKSNHTSIVEFYAPWCGHCKNLQPVWEKAATSLQGLAKVAAVNCDEESNKAFCGSMGVQGFPTLKIVKPSKKAGARGVPQDYNGERTAKAIVEAVKEKIPSHVERIKDDSLDSWLAKTPERPKVLFLGEKGLTPVLVKALAIDFLGGIDFGYARSADKKVTAKYGVVDFPSVLLFDAEGGEPTKYRGEMKKKPLLEFFSTIHAPNPDAKPPTSKKSKPKSDKAKTKKDSKAKDDPAQCPHAAGATSNPHAASETLEPQDDPHPSPNPNVATHAPAPAQMPIQPAPALQSLADEDALQKSCLHAKASTCILAVMPPGPVIDETSTHPVLTSLAEIAHKHASRGSKLFPFYAIPADNAAGQSLVEKLGLSHAKNSPYVIGVNAKRAWWSGFEGMDTMEAMELWIDNIRFGDVRKETIPEGVVQAIEEEVAKEEPVDEEVVVEEGETIKVEVVEEEIVDRLPRDEL